MPPTAVTILVAHGSRNPAAQRAHEALAESVAAASGAATATDGASVGGADTELRTAYLEMAEPDIATAIDRAVDDGATSVRLLPCFLHPGNHVESDIPEIAREARDRHPHVAIEVMAHLGSDEGLVDLLAAMVQAR